MFKSNAKNIFICIFWLLMLSFSAFIFYQYHVLNSYTQTSYTIEKSTYFTGARGSQYIAVTGSYTTKNNEVYPLKFTGPVNSYKAYRIYYNPEKPTVYKVSAYWPQAEGYIPIGVAALVTILAYSKITFLSKTSEKALEKRLRPFWLR